MDPCGFQIDTKPLKQSRVLRSPTPGSTCLPAPLTAPYWSPPGDRGRGPEFISYPSGPFYWVPLLPLHGGPGTPGPPCARKASPRARHGSPPGSCWPLPWGWTLGTGLPFSSGLLQHLSPRPFPGREEAEASKRREQIKKTKAPGKSGQVCLHTSHTKQAEAPQSCCGL